MTSTGLAVVISLGGGVLVTGAVYSVLRPDRPSGPRPLSTRAFGVVLAISCLVHGGAAIVVLPDAGRADTSGLGMAVAMLAIGSLVFNYAVQRPERVVSLLTGNAGDAQQRTRAETLRRVVAMQAAGWFAVGVVLMLL